MSHLAQSIEIFKQLSLDFKELAKNYFSTDSQEGKDKLLNLKTYRDKKCTSNTVKTAQKGLCKDIKDTCTLEEPLNDDSLLSLDDYDNSIDSDSDADGLINIGEEGWKVNLNLYCIRINMGPFHSKRKTKEVVNYLKKNKAVIGKMKIEERKKWLKDFSQLMNSLIT